MSKYAPHRPSSTNPRPTSSTICQKCYGRGHFIYECKSARPYLSRPSRTQQLENPRLLAKLRTEGKPSVEVPEEFKKKKGTADKILEAKERERAEAKRSKEGDAESRKRKRSGSVSSSSSSDSETGSSSGSESDSDSQSASDSRESSSTSGSSQSRRRDSKRTVRRKRSQSPSGNNSANESPRRGRN